VPFLATSKNRYAVKISPPITWFGGKSKLAARIVQHFPEHRTYVEPFGGSAAVLLAKSPAKVEVYNDIDRDLSNLFRILRDEVLFKRLKESCENTAYSRAEFELALEPTTDPVEAARRFVVRQRQSHGGIGRRWSYCIQDAQSGMSSAVRRWLSGIERLPAIHRRMRQVQIEADDWELVVKRYDTPQTLFYLDPPYAAHTRIGGGYRHELAESDHHRLVETLMNISGMSVLSGYQCEAYTRLEMADWRRVDYDVPSYMSPRRERRRESQWISPSAPCHPAASPSSLQRMRQGAYLTHRQRTGNTEARILSVIATLREQRKRVTFCAVAEQLDMSREHLSRRYRHLFGKT
jgi:DNA adenine methylase